MTTKAMKLWAALLGLALWGTAQAGTVTYVYTDPQGTPLMETDAQGNITARYEYTPYGVPVTSMGAAPDGVGYTGHVNDPETGLVYMQARYYDAEVGRFLSVDPHPTTAGKIFFNNRYVYANNSPVRYSDEFGDKPGDRFKTPELAAFDALTFINATSIATNHEFHGWIGVDGDQFYATNPVMISETGGPGTLPPSHVAGDYHTHGNYSIEVSPGKFIVTGDPARDNLSSDAFSVKDILRYQESEKGLGAFRGYLGTPGGKFYVYVKGKYYDLEQVIKVWRQQQENEKRQQQERKEEQEREWQQQQQQQQQ